jgi:hypothetical protein
MDTTILTNIPDNTDQLVTPALVRATLEDMADSALWLDEGGAGPVDSVNGYTGAVVLTATDVGAIATGDGALLAGATFTGPVAFSGTTNSGIRFSNLTTTQRDALTPLAGMKIWNTTTGAEQVYDGADWIGASGIDLNAEIDAIQLAGGAELTEFNANIATAAADGGAPFDLATAADIWAVEAGNLPIVAQELGNAEAYVSITPTAGDYTIDGELGWHFKDTALAGNADFATVSNLTPHRRSVYIKASGGTRTLTATGVVATSNIASGVDIATGDTGRFDFYINAAGDSTCEFMGAEDWLLGASGVVLESAYNANTILAADTDDTPAPVTIAEERIVGRITAGNIKGLTAAETRTFVGTATTSATGVVELATTAEINTGTDTARVLGVDEFAASNFATAVLEMECFSPTTDVSTGNGAAYATIPACMNGMNLVRAQATVITAGTTNATTVMVHNLTDGVDMLSGAISIASAGVAGTVGTIDAAADDVATDDRIRIDVDSVSTTKPKGLTAILEFRLP